MVIMSFLVPDRLAVLCFVASLAISSTLASPGSEQVNVTQPRLVGEIGIVN
jgi:hypothetical protein